MTAFTCAAALLYGLFLLRRPETRLSGVLLSVAGALALVVNLADIQSKLLYTVIFFAFLGYLSVFVRELYWPKSGSQA